MLCLGRRAGVEDWIFAKTLVPGATVNDVARARPRSKSVAKERSGLHHALKQNSLGKVRFNDLTSGSFSRPANYHIPRL